MSHVYCVYNKKVWYLLQGGRLLASHHLHDAYFSRYFFVRLESIKAKRFTIKYFLIVRG